MHPCQESAPNYGRTLALYLQMVPMDRVLDSLGLSGNQNVISVEMQHDLVSKVFQHPLAVEFPPQRSYVTKLVKSIFSIVEASRAEVDESLLALVMDMVMSCGVSSRSDSSGLQGVSFLTFLPPDGTEQVPISIRTSTECNQVGLRVWEAGFLLAEYAIYNPEVFENKRVLEIGAGVGLTGLEIASHCKPRDVVFTDHDEVVLSNLRWNVENNQEACRKQGKDEKGTVSNVTVEYLDWCDDDCVHQVARLSSDSEQELFDVVLAADCVYDPSGFQPLAEMLSKMFTASFNKGKELLVVFAYTLRNQSTFESFEKVLEERNIQTVDIAAKVPQDVAEGCEWFHYDNTTMLNRFTQRSSIRLCKLRMVTNL